MKKKHILLIIIGLIVLGAAFYWFDIRPRQIRAICQQEVDDKYQQLFDRNYQHQADGSIVSKQKTSHKFTIEDGKNLRDAAQEEYQPCLRRHNY